MAGGLHEWIQRRIVKSVIVQVVDKVQQRQVIGDTQGAYRIPHTEEPDGYPLGRLMYEFPTFLFPYLPVLTFIPVAILEDAVDPVPDIGLRQPGQIKQTHMGNHPGEAADRIRTSAESEEENVVATLVVVTEFAVCAHDIFIEALPCSPANNLIPPRTLCSDAGMVVTVLAVTVTVEFCDCIIEPYNICRNRNAIIQIVRRVPGSIAANNDILNVQNGLLPFFVVVAVLLSGVSYQGLLENVPLLDEAESKRTTFPNCCLFLDISGHLLRIFFSILF